jgi:hypothetical protein
VFLFLKRLILLRNSTQPLFLSRWVHWFVIQVNGEFPRTRLELNFEVRLPEIDE